jgi:hypothetical protein
LPGGEDLPGPDGAEGVEGLDAQFDEALEEFDESVLGQGSAAEEEGIDILNPMGGGSSGLESNEPIFEEGDLGEAEGTGEDAEFAERASEGAAGEMTGSQTEGQQNSSSSSGGKGEGNEDIIPIPDDIGDGRNDDIVLRQIRDAAMKEQDPVLREKLWDEYRRIRDQR